MFKKVVARVKENIRVAESIYSMVLESREADIKNFVPGQFANLSIPGHKELLLKRPLSICKADDKSGTVTLIYQIKGKGTSVLKELPVGQTIETIMPVGRGFNISGNQKNVFLVGGGVGIAPLLSVTAKWSDRYYEAFLGYRGKDYMYCYEEMSEACKNVYVTTDDGTFGVKGLVTELFEKRLNEIKPDIVLACGPLPMLRGLKKILEIYKIPAQVSMEERMCCGFGACATCVCAVNTGSSKSRETFWGEKGEEGLDYKKVCIEGPVFDMSEVIL